MKLFQQLLVAGASLSLVAPIGVQAADINLEDMNSYSRSTKSKRFNKNFSKIQTNDWIFQSIEKLTSSHSCDVSIPNRSITRYEAASIINACLKDVAEVTPSEMRLINEFSTELAALNTRLDSPEVELSNYEAGGFSDTTTLSGSAVFAIGAVDGADKVDTSDTETVQTLYTYTMDLNTSFTGDDNLYVRLRTGANGSALGQKPAVYHPDRYSGTTDLLAVDKIWYQFPVGESITAWVGPKIENYYMYAASPSIYKPASQKAFKLGSASAAFGASTAAGVGFKYEFGEGWAVGSNVVSKGARGSSDGFLTDEDVYKWDTMVAYTKDQYHLSLTLSQQYNGWNSYSYYATTAATTLFAGNDGKNKPNAQAWATRAYWRPQESGTVVPEVSVGFDNISVTGNGSNFSEASSYFIGLGWNDIVRPDDSIGLAFGQPLKPTEMGEGSTPTLDPSMWEAYYSFLLNDSVRIIPAVFGGNDVLADSEDDIFGAMVTAKFKF